MHCAPCTMLVFLNNLWGLEPSRNRVIVPARHSTLASGIGSLASIPWLHKSLKIRAQNSGSRKRWRKKTKKIFFDGSEEKRICSYLNYRRNEEKFVPKLSKKRRHTKVFAPQPSKNEEKLMHSSLNYQRDEEKQTYLFLNNRRNEEKLIHPSLNYQRDEQKLIYCS